MKGKIMDLPDVVLLRTRAYTEAQIRLIPQQLRLFEVLARRYVQNRGPLDYATLACAIDSKSPRPRRLLSTRLPRLRIALKLFGVDIANARNKGYSLCEAP